MSGRARTRARVERQPSELTDHDLAEALSWVQAARALAVERFPYLDVALTAMVPVARVGLGTVAVDARWRFYYDPARTLTLAETGGGVDALVADWVHEVGHVLRDHHQRWADLAEPPTRHDVYNVAGDALINADLTDLGLPLLPTDVTFQRLPPAAGARRDMTTEEIYLRLRDATVACARDCGSGSGGDRRPWEDPVDDPGAGTSDPAATTPPGRTGDPADDGSVDPGRADSIREETATKIRAAARGQGSAAVPPGLRAWSDTVLEPAVDWRRELRSAVSRGLAPVTGRRDYAWGRPSRRRVPGYVLPGMVAPAPPSVAVVVDTSGSMSPDDLAQCVADITGIVRAATTPGATATPVRVLACDASTGDVQSVRDRAGAQRLHLTGGGGTDMRVGIDAAATLRPTPDVIVVLTDGLTPWPDQPPSRAPSARYVAVLVGADADGSVPGWIHAIRAEVVP